MLYFTATSTDHVPQSDWFKMLPTALPCYQCQLVRFENFEEMKSLEKMTCSDVVDWLSSVERQRSFLKIFLMLLKVCIQY